MGFSFIRLSSSFVRLFLISLILSTFFSNSISTPVVNYEVCESPWCKEIATQLKNAMNESANPCDDFYEYMCGGFIKNNPMAANQYQINQITKTDEKITLQLREILDSSVGENDTDTLIMIKNIYKMCQDTETIDSLGISPLVNLINKNGGWPIAESNVNKSVPWQKLFKLGNPVSTAIVVIYIDVDMENNDKNIIWLFEPQLFLSSEVYLNPEEHKNKLDAYRDLIEDVVKVFVNATGISVAMEFIRKDVEDIIKLETKLINISQPIEQVTNNVSSFDVMTIDELQQKYDSQKQLTVVSKIDWLSTIRTIFSSSDMKINGSEKVLIFASQYIFQLSKILDETSHRTVVNFMQWQLIRNSLRFLDNNTRETLSRYKKRVNEVEREEERWRKCLSLSRFETALSYEYVKKYFPHSAKEEMHIIVENIKEEMEKEIFQTKWMDEETKSVSIDKLRNMKSQIGYPDWYNATAIDLYYDGMNITSNYFESLTNAITYEATRQLRKLRKPVDKNESFRASLDTYGYYDRYDNAVFLSAGLLKEPAFDRLRPPALNYGAIGMLVGHVISHAFRNGKKNKDKWWSNYTIDKYEAIEKCFVDQYNQYTIPELFKNNQTVYLNGNLTFKNNIADSAGIAVSYEAFKTRFDYSKQKEIKLPGFERFSADQMFFMSFANMFCERKSLTELEDSVENAIPPRRFRIRGALSNFPKFADSFNCPLGSPMNPQKKCSLWK